MSVLPAQRKISSTSKARFFSDGGSRLCLFVIASFCAFAADKARGMDGYDQRWAVVDETRKLLAPHLPAADEIALIGNASEGIVKALSSIEWREATMPSSVNGLCVWPLCAGGAGAFRCRNPIGAG